MKNESAFWQRCLERGEQLLAPQPRSHTETYRHELKYLISWADKAELTTRMSPVLKLDPHATNGGYFIRSLYFDDYWNTAYEEKDAGVLLRKKYRIRIYNCSDRSIKLERKKKFGSYIYKEAAPLTHAEFDAILAGDYTAGSTLCTARLPLSLPELMPGKSQKVSVTLEGADAQELLCGGWKRLFRSPKHLTIGIVDPMTSRDAVRFAMKAARKNGRTVLL